MTYVKICGITNTPDAEAAVELGADAVGLNFHERSPRFVTESRAAEIVRALQHVPAIGVFVSQAPSEMIAIAGRVGLRALQTYQHDIPHSLIPSTPHVLAHRMQSSADVTTIRERVMTLKAASVPIMAVLIDAFVSGEWGGTGRTAPWDLLVGADFGAPLILAGGLTPDNAADAIRMVRPWGVDVASGIEAAPGRKDHGRMKAFIDAVRGAAG